MVYFEPSAEYSCHTYVKDRLPLGIAQHQGIRIPSWSTGRLSIIRSHVLQDRTTYLPCYTD